MVSPSSVFVVDVSIAETEKEKFVYHRGSGPFDSYLAMVVPYEPVRALRERLEKRLGQQLKDRGESHITVITPPEFENSLRSHLSIEEIEEIALRMNIQSIDFETDCIGLGQAMIDGALEQTYFIVVRSKELGRLRRAIADAFIAKGGKPARFNADSYEPHITLGFTRTDLHQSNGVRKGPASCVAPLKVEP